MSSKQAEAELERVYTVPLSRAWITARHRRTKRAVRILREFATKHMKSSDIKIDTDLNEMLWKRGITKPPRRVTVKMAKDEDGLVTISLPKESKKEEKSKEREEKDDEEENKPEAAEKIAEAPSTTEASEKPAAEKTAEPAAAKEVEGKKTASGKRKPATTAKKKKSSSRGK